MQLAFNAIEEYKSPFDFTFGSVPLIQKESAGSPSLCCCFICLFFPHGLISTKHFYHPSKWMNKIQPSFPCSAGYSVSNGKLADLPPCLLWYLSSRPCPEKLETSCLYRSQLLFKRQNKHSLSLAAPFPSAVKNN